MVSVVAVTLGFSFGVGLDWAGRRRLPGGTAWHGRAGPAPGQGPGPGRFVAAGPGLVRRRTVYFEAWAIDEVAATLATRPELIHGVPPRRSPAILADAGRVVRPNGNAEPLTIR